MPRRVTWWDAFSENGAVSLSLYGSPVFASRRSHRPRFDGTDAQSHPEPRSIFISSKGKSQS